MKLENYKNWNEIFTEIEFHIVLNELFTRKNELSKSIVLEIVNLVSERYLLFYGSTKLTKNENEEINNILIELTDFTDLSIIEELIGIMFNFRLNSYYIFLKNNIDFIKLDVVKKEVIESLKEYEVIN